MAHWRHVVGLSTDDIGHSSLPQNDPIAALYDTEAQVFPYDITNEIATSIEDTGRQGQWLTEAGNHHYGPLTATGNARLLNGNAHYSVGSGSTINGPSTVNGDMNIEVRNAFYSWNHDLLGNKTAEGKLETLKAALYYASMDDRKAQLADVKPASFAWIWIDTTFPQWLENTQDIFWISGKPGSGKSTLMYYLADSDFGRWKVQQHLQSHKKSWLILRFYFDFRAGQGISNTPLGMLRSLLLQVVEKSKVVAEIVSKRTAHRHGGNWPQLEAELLDLFSEALGAVNLTICAFLDGLDEFEGDLRKLMQTITTLQRRTGMKICLASRPESELAFALRDKPGFAMQAHNHSSIKAYIHDARASLQGYTFVESLDVIFQSIEEQANGVILWARFAVDDVISAAIAGYPADDIKEKLQAFPPQLQGVYNRIWDALSKFKLQAAVAFFLSDNWDSSFQNCATKIPLYAEEFMVLWCKTMHRLQPTTLFGPNFTETQFRLRIHAMIKGLIEFVPAGDKRKNVTTVRLVHKSLQTFLMTRQEYAELIERIEVALPLNSFGPRFYAEAIVDASDELEPDSYVVWKEKGMVTLSEDRLTFILSQSRRREQVQSIGYTPACLARALGNILRFDILDSSEHVCLLIAAAQSCLAQTFLHPVSQRFQSKYEPFSDGFEKSLPLWSRLHIEVHWFARARLNCALDKVLQQYLGIMPPMDKYFLYACMLVYQTGDTMLQPAFIRLIDATLDILPWQIHYFTLTVVSYDSTLFEYISSRLPSSVSAMDRCLPSLPSWPHPRMDVMCQWAISPYEVDCAETQRRRLKALVDMGLSINDRIYEGGTVLHMLFENVDYPWNSWQYLWTPHRLACVRPQSLTWEHSLNFSKAKFDALMQYDVDLSSRSSNSSAIESAESLRQNLLLTKAKTLMDQNPIEIDREHYLLRIAEYISVIEDHVLPTLVRRVQRELQ